MHVAQKATPSDDARTRPSSTGGSRWFPAGLLIRQGADRDCPRMPGIVDVTPASHRGEQERISSPEMPTVIMTWSGLSIG
jgi:hypothetical protein